MPPPRGSQCINTMGFDVGMHELVLGCAAILFPIFSMNSIKRSYKNGGVHVVCPVVTRRPLSGPAAPCGNEETSTRTSLEQRLPSFDTSDATSSSPRPPHACRHSRRSGTAAAHNACAQQFMKMASS